MSQPTWFAFILKLVDLMLFFDNFLQGDHLKDCSKGTRVVAAFLKTSWKLILFTKFIMTLGLKTGFLNPRLKMNYT